MVQVTNILCFLQGCYEKIKDKVKPYQIYIIAGAGGGIGLQVSRVCLSKNA